MRVEDRSEDLRQDIDVSNSVLWEDCRRLQRALCDDDTKTRNTAERLL